MATATTARLSDSPTPPPWENRGTWCFSIIGLPAQRHPFTHNAYAETVDHAGNYRGIELGPTRSRALAERSVRAFTTKPPAPQP